MPDVSMIALLISKVVPSTSGKFPPKLNWLFIDSICSDKSRFIESIVTLALSIPVMLKTKLDLMYMESLISGYRVTKLSGCTVSSWKFVVIFKFSVKPSPNKLLYVWKIWFAGTAVVSWLTIVSFKDSLPPMNLANGFIRLVGYPLFLK